MLPTNGKENDMKLPSRIQSVSAFAAAVVVGGGAAIALAAITSVSQSAPALHARTTPTVEIVRLEPVVVTLSKARFDAIRAEAKVDGAVDTAVARATDSRRVTRG